MNAHAVQEVVEASRRLGVMIPVAALLLQDELRTLVRATLARGTAADVKALVARLYSTSAGVGVGGVGGGVAILPALNADELLAELLVAADAANAREDLATERERLQLLTSVTTAAFAPSAREFFSQGALLNALRRLVDSASISGDKRPAVPTLFPRAVALTIQAHPATRAGVAELLASLLRRCGVRVFDLGAPAAGSPIWEGFLLLMKALVPLSLPIAAYLDESFLAALIVREAPLAARLRTWAAASAGLPEHVSRLLLAPDSN